MVPADSLFQWAQTTEEKTLKVPAEGRAIASSRGTTAVAELHHFGGLFIGREAAIPAVNAMAQAVAHGYRIRM